MITAFVSSSRGNDATGAGTASNPWRTANKAIGSSPALSPTDLVRLYLEPGVYREAVNMGFTPTSANRLEIIGDVDGSGFAAGGYSSPKTGLVDWSAWSDDVTPLSGPCLNATNKSYVTVENILFVAGNTVGPYWSGGLNIKGGTDWTVRNCIAVGSYLAVASTGLGYEGAAGGGAANILFDRCDAYAPPRPFGGVGIGVWLYEQAAEYDANVVIRNCRSFYTTSQGGGSCIAVFNVGGSGGKLGTGITVEFCTLIGGTNGIQVYRSDATKPLASPVVVRGCLTYLTAGGIIAGLNSHVSETYNVWNTFTPRTSVDIGTGSVSGVRPAVGYDEGRAYGLPRRPLFAPDDLSVYKVPASAGFAFPTVDRYGRPRNADTAAGAVEAGFDASAVDPSASLINGGLIR